MVRSALAQPERWFATPVFRPHAQATLFCLPYVGGATSAFRGWQQAFGPAIEVLPVQLPGRESRISESPVLDPREIAAAIADRVDRPYAIYGHSMGARLGFEVIRELRRRGEQLPARFYVGGSRPPHLDEPIVRIAHLPDDRFVEELLRLGGTPEQALHEPELRELMLPLLRADFGWIDQYRYCPEAPLPVPIVGFGGTGDTTAEPLVMLDWAAHTSAGFRLHTLTGNHFFLNDHQPKMAELISADLLAAVPAGVEGGVSGGWDGAPLAAPDEDEVHVWSAVLDDLPALCAAIDELSPRERDRAARFRAESDRRWHIGRSAVLRRLLGRYGVDVGTAELLAGPRGKPTVPNPLDLRFNLSHCAGLVLVAVTRGAEVGVDVERLRPLADFAAFCDGALDPAERAELTDVSLHGWSAEARLRHALQLWTAKEAVLKASGDGLYVEPNRLNFASQQPGTPWRARVDADLARLGPWRVTHLPLDGALGAVAVAQDSWRLRFETVMETPQAGGRQCYAKTA
jgi:surfactin synthase thioesterase subunit/phosphopantetheinyl transferase